MSIRPFVQARGEFTKVGLESEIQIPFRTWLICAAVTIADVLSVVGTMILVSRQFHNWTHPPRVYGQRWWPSVVRALAIWWPSIGIAILVGVVAWSVPLLYRFLVETVTKQGPQYTPYPSEKGRWKPFSRGDPYDEYDAEAEVQSPARQGLYAVEGVLKTGSGSEIYLKFDLDDHASALKWHHFCKAVYYDKKNFSYTQAVKRNHLSDDDWERIYTAFIAQQWVIPSGPKGTPKLKGPGKAWVHMYAETPPTPPPA